MQYVGSTISPLSSLFLTMFDNHKSCSRWFAKKEIETQVGLFKQFASMGHHGIQ